MDAVLPYPRLTPVPIRTKGISLFKRILAWLFETRQWKIVEDYTIYIPFLGLTLFVPKGFIFDGASIPRALWWVLAPTGILFIPSLFHDIGYRYAGLAYALPNGGYAFNPYSKHELDSILARMTEYINDMKAPGKIAQCGLWLGGWLAWCKARRVDRSFFIDFPSYPQNGHHGANWRQIGNGVN